MEESVLSGPEKDFNTKPFKKIQCACPNLKMASWVVGRAYDSALASSDLNSTQYSILINIFRCEPVSQMSLADLLKWKEPLSIEPCPFWRKEDG